MPESKERAYEKKLIKKLIVKARKRARRQENAVFLNAGLMGILGWHIVIPVILGAAAGLALDRLIGRGNWCFITLMLLGVVCGMYNVDRWAKKHMASQKKETEVVLESEKNMNRPVGEE